MSISQEIRQRAKQDKKKIVLPEGEEPRMIEAAQIIYQDNLAELIFLGKEDKIRKIASVKNIHFPEDIEIINPENSEKLQVKTLSVLWPSFSLKIKPSITKMKMAS